MFLFVFCTILCFLIFQELGQVYLHSFARVSYGFQIEVDQHYHTLQQIALSSLIENLLLFNIHEETSAYSQLRSENKSKVRIIFPSTHKSLEKFATYVYHYSIVEFPNHRFTYQFIVMKVVFLFLWEFL